MSFDIFLPLKWNVHYNKQVPWDAKLPSVNYCVLVSDGKNNSYYDTYMMYEWMKLENLVKTFNSMISWAKKNKMKVEGEILGIMTKVKKDGEIDDKKKKKIMISIGSKVLIEDYEFRISK